MLTNGPMNAPDCPTGHNIDHDDCHCAHGPLLDHVNKRSDDHTDGHADGHALTRAASYRGRGTENLTSFSCSPSHLPYLLNGNQDPVNDGGTRPPWCSLPKM